MLNTSGITTTTHGANGAAITNYDLLLDAVGAVRANNFEPNAQIQAPRTETSLAKLKEATTNAYLAPPAALADVPRLHHQADPDQPHRRHQHRLPARSTRRSGTADGRDPHRLLNCGSCRERFLADNLQYAFLAYLRADVQLAQPAAFVVDTGVRG